MSKLYCVYCGADITNTDSSDELQKCPRLSRGSCIPYMGIEPTEPNGEVCVSVAMRQALTRESELAKKIPEIGRHMAEIKINPIEFSVQTSGVETHEEIVCNIIADILQQREHLGPDGGYEGTSKRRIEDALNVELKKGTRDLGEDFNVCKKLMAWLYTDPNFCKTIHNQIRHTVYQLLEAAYKLT